MEHLTGTWLVFLLTSGFVASFIDSVVGGGGLISLPALLLTGLPVNIALGTNKLASSFSALTSTILFLRSGKVNRKLVGHLFPLSFFGSIIGAYTVQHVPPDFLKPLVVVMLVVVAVYTALKRDWGFHSTFSGITVKIACMSGLFALALGCYDGFFGPGTGSFLIFAFLMLGFDFVQAAGNAKVLNFASNLGALMTFFFLDSINYSYGLVMIGGMIAGAFTGSRVAIHHGARYVRPLFLIVTVFLIGKQIFDVVGH